MTEAKEELFPGLTSKSLAISIPLVLIFAVLSNLVGLYTDKSGTFGTFLIPMVYFVVIFELLGRANRKWRLTPQEYVFIFTVFSFLGMHSWFTMHAAAHNNPLMFITFSHWLDYLAFGIGDLKDFWSQATPPMLAPPEPLRFQISDMIMMGRAPGQPVPWGPLIQGSVYWGLVFLFYSFISMFVTFAVGRIWVEEERLAFPLSVPSIYLFREAGEVDPTTNKSRLFDLVHPATKVFWAMFIIGIISGINPLIAELLPVFPIAAWWGETNLSIDFLAAIWPGVYASAIFFIPQIAVGLIMPNDVLFTLIIGWIIFGLLYQGIAVSMHIVPYNPGMEFVWPWEDYPGQWLPFPYRTIAANGIAFGIALWLVIRHRKRIGEIISTAWKGDIVERGLSMRTISMLLLVGAVGWYILIVAAGGDPIIALLVPFWAFMFNFMYARVFAEVFWHVGTGWDRSWDLTYQLGVLTRGWPNYTAVTWDNPNTNPAWMTVAHHIWAVGQWNISFSPLSSGIMVSMYKIAHELKMRMRDFLVALIIGALVLIFVFIPLEEHFILSTKGGLANTNVAGSSWTPWGPAGWYHRGYWVQEGETPELVAGYYWLGGMLLTFVLYFLRARFAWFFINVPALYVSMTIVTYMWLTSLIALIIKYIAIRTVGIKRYEEYVMPTVAGWIIGFGAVWLIAAILNLGGVVVPKFFSLYQP